MEKVIAIKVKTIINNRHAITLIFNPNTSYINLYCINHKEANKGSKNKNTFLFLIFMIIF